MEAIFLSENPVLGIIVKGRSLKVNLYLSKKNKEKKKKKKKKIEEKKIEKKTKKNRKKNRIKEREKRTPSVFV